MNWDRFAGRWRQLTGQAKSKWGRLTDDDLKNVSGKKDQLVGLLQERYGILKDQAERQVEDWISKRKDKAERLIDEWLDKLK